MIALAALALCGLALYWLATSELLRLERKHNRVAAMARRVDARLAADDSPGNI